MDKDIAEYLEATFTKVRQIKASDKGKVWLATDASGNLVIIKHIFLTGLPYKALKKQNPFICPRIYQCIEDASETVVVEEYVSGQSLTERLRDKRHLSEQEAKNILLRLCDGLAPIHAQGIIHRDIKPSNLMLQHGGIIRLIDFDAARIVKENGREDTKLLGTKGYAPPEQYGYGQTDARSDIYAIGVTMQKLLGEDYHGVLTKILQKCTQLDPKNRYASVTALKQAILWQDRRKKIFALAFAALIVAISVSVVWRRQPPTVQTPLPDIPRQSDNTEATGVKTLSGADTKTTETEQGQIAALPPNDSTNTKASYFKNSIRPPVPKNPAENLPVKQETAPVPSAQTTLPPHNVTPAGNIRANLYINGDAYDKLHYDLDLPKTEWQKQNWVLHLTNNSNTTWERPTLRVVFTDNWGGKQTREQVLPPLAPNDATDFTISPAIFTPSESADVSTYPYTSVWVQIYLNQNDVPLSESYWCINYTLNE